MTIVDEVDKMLGVGPEIFEDLKDSVKTGKQPFDHVYETLLYMSYSTLIACIRDMILMTTWGGLPPYFLIDTCIVHDPTFL